MIDAGSGIPGRPSISPRRARIVTIITVFRRLGLAANAESPSENSAPAAGQSPKAQIDSLIEAKLAEQQIDALLASEGYVSHFFNFWADVLRFKTPGSGRHPPGCRPR